MDDKSFGCCSLLCVEGHGWCGEVQGEGRKEGINDNRSIATYKLMCLLYNVFYDVIDKSTVEVLKLSWRVIYIIGKFYEIVFE